jgi:hypothetical protein
MRRLSAALTLLFSTVMTLAVPTTVQASSSAPEPEMIARAIGTQTTGPSGFMSPNDVMPWGLDRIDSRTGRDNSFTYTTDGAGVKAYVVDPGGATALERLTRLVRHLLAITVRFPITTRIRQMALRRVHTTRELISSFHQQLMERAKMAMSAELIMMVMART